MGVLTPTPYATLADVYNLGLPQGALSQVSTPQQQAALNSACAEADSYLTARFKLPLTSWDAILVQHVCCRAAYTMLVARGYNPDDGADKNIFDRSKQALDWYKGVADGVITPNVVDSTTGIPGDMGSRFANQPVVSPGIPSPSNATLSLGYGPPTTTQNPTGFVTVGSPNLRGY